MKDVTLSHFGGINNVLPAERLRSEPSRESQAVDLTEAVNVDLDETGRISRRAGMTMMLEGPAHSLWSNGELCFYVQDGMMYQLSNSLESWPIAGGLSEARMHYAEVNGRVYHSNGKTNAVYDNGRVRGWGIPVGLINISAAITAGTMPAGVYQFNMTLLRADGQESGCGIAHRIDLPENGGLVFNWIVPQDPSIVRAAIYLTQPNSETLLQAAIVDIDDGQLVYTGGPRSLPLATQWLDKPPAGDVVALHKGRIYIGSGPYLYATAPLSYEHCDLRDYRSIDGTAIRVIAPVEGGLFIGTDIGIYFLGGAAFTENTLTKKMEARAVADSAVLADGADVTGRAELEGTIVALFATSEGIVMGMPDGSLSNFTRERFAFEADDRGAAIFRTLPVPQYLFSP